MRRWLWIIPICIALLFLPVTAVSAAEEPPAGVDVSDELGELEDAVRELDDYLAAQYDDLSLFSLFERLLSGDMAFELGALPAWFLRFLLAELSIVAALLAQLFLLGVIAAVFRSIRDGFGEGRIAVVGQWIIFLTFATIALKALQTAIAIGTQAIETATGLLYAILPVLLTILSSLGGLTAMMVVRPTVFFLITLYLGLLERFFLPLVLVLAALALINNISPNFSFSHLAKLIRDVTLICLTMLLTVFTGLLTMGSLGAAAVDGLTLKLAKSAVGTFIPIVGGHIADALDSLLGASLLLKNTVGIFGLVAIAVVIMLPALRVFISSLCFRLAAAVLEPFGKSPYIQMLQDFGSVLLLLFALVAVTGLLFFLLIFFVVGLGNLTMMFR